MATAITILANFPCCCDQLCLFWYNIHGDTQTDHGGGEGVETGMRPAGNIPFPVRIQGMSSNGGMGGAEIQVPVFYSSTRCSSGFKHSTTIRRAGVGSTMNLRHILHIQTTTPKR